MHRVLWTTYKCLRQECGWTPSAPDDHTAQCQVEAHILGHGVHPLQAQGASLVSDCTVTLTPDDTRPAAEGFSHEKSMRIGEKAFALSAWFKARGEKPAEWMDLFSEIMIDDSPLTAEEIAIGQRIAAERGWLLSDAGEGNQQPRDSAADPVAPRTVTGAMRVSESSSSLPILDPALRERAEQLQALLCDVAQVFDGWRQDDSEAWSEWDEAVRERVSDAIRDLEFPQKPMI